MRNLATIHADRAQARSKISDLTAESEGLLERSAGTLTPGQAQRAERLATGIDNAQAELDALDDEAKDAIRSLADEPSHIEETEAARPERPTPSGRYVNRAQLETAALRAVERHGLSGPAADRLERVIRDVDEDPQGFGARYLAAVAAPAYQRAFTQVLADPTWAHLRMSPEELASIRTVHEADSMRALSLTGASGGFAVPFALDPTLIGTSNGTAADLRRVSRVVTIATDTWRGVSSGAITAAYAAEATETTDNAPTLAQPEISTEKAQAFIPFSIEVGMDWATIQAELGGLLQESKDDLEAVKFTAGSGTNEPFGVITGATNTVNATTGQTVDAEDVYRLEQALPARYQARAAYMASGTIINTLYRLVGGGSVEPALVSEDRTRLLGKPLVINSEMATTTATGVKFLLYGDFSRFVIVDRIGLQVELIPHLFGTNHRPTGQRGLYAFWRNSSKVVDANAFRLLIGIA